MHTILTTEELRRALELVGRISTKHISLPVLQCVLLKTTDNGLTLTATNLEIGIEVMVEARVEDQGVIAVPASALIQTIQLHPGKEVTLRVEEETLVVEGKDSTTQIKTIPYDEFPTIPHVGGKGQSVNGQTLALGLKSVAFAASQSSIKPELGSIYIAQKKEQTLTFVATDSFRLMEKTVAQSGVVLAEPLLVPYKNALELIRVLEAQEKDPELLLDENQLALRFDNGVYITSRLVSGSFPDYAQIIPKEYVSHTTLLKHDLLHALKKTNIFLNKFFQVAMVVEENSLTITANSGEVGTTTESIAATTTGDELTLSFNQRYITEPLAYFNEESILLHFAGVGRPLVMEPLHDKSLRYLVMPMNK